MKFHPSMLNLYFICGSQDTNSNVEEFLTTLEEACKAGITIFQFREKGPGSLDGEAKEQLAKAAFAITRRYGVPFIVDDDVELALRIGADGIHVGQTDEIASEVVKRAPHMIIGLTVHNKEELERSGDLTSIDYLGVGPVFPTNSKSDAKEPIGVEGILEMHYLSPLPIVAIGGIHQHNVKELLALPIPGIAVISEITKAENVEETVHQLLRPSRTILSKIKKLNPIVLNVANAVTPQYVADAISFIGGSPIMFEDTEDGKELAKIAGAITLNMGTPTPNSLAKALIVGKVANKRNIPVLLDPVAIGATKVRRTHTEKVLKKVKVDFIRGNVSEIAALLGSAWSGKGIDAEKGASFKKEYAVAVAVAAARKTGATIILSGETDIITDGHTVYAVTNGHPYLTVNVGSGDILDAIIATATAVDRSLETTAYATAILSVAADMAIEKTLGKPYSFFHEIWDTLGTMTDRDLCKRIHIQQIELKEELA